jgi:hypothetical protein
VGAVLQAADPNFGQSSPDVLPDANACRAALLIDATITQLVPTFADDSATPLSQGPGRQT